MRLRLLNPAQGVPDGYTYQHKETGYTNKGGSMYALLQECIIHRTGNNLPIPDDFAEQVEHQICMRLPESYSVPVSGIRDTSCQFRGEETRRVLCEQCCGGKGIHAKVLACSIHGECTQFSKDIGIKACWACTDRKPLTEEG